jgi:hypothetical protein
MREAGRAESRPQRLQASPVRAVEKAIEQVVAQIDSGQLAVSSAALLANAPCYPAALWDQFLAGAFNRSLVTTSDKNRDGFRGQWWAMRNGSDGTNGSGCNDESVTCRF